jgi:spermidine synthase
VENFVKENQFKNSAMWYRVKEVLLDTRSEFQKIDVVDTYDFGRMLLLDNVVQVTEKDEYVYSEMITHVPLFTHQCPKTVLVIGGGDGGVLKEILKHPTIEEIVLCEIDKEVIEYSKKLLSKISLGFFSSKVETYIGDGLKYVEENLNRFDLIIVDSTDPVGMAENLFMKDFYKKIYKCLKEDGIFITQSETPFYLPDLVKDIFYNVQSIFPITKLFMAAIPSYPSGYWSFTLGSKKYDPTTVDLTEKIDINTKYYSKELHKASFILPRYVAEILIN